MSSRAATAGAPSSAAPPHHHHLRTCSDDENYAVYGGASTSEPDTDELMDGRGGRAGPGPGARVPTPSAAVVKFHPGAAAAVAGGIGTDADDDWLFDLRRPPSRDDADGDQHRGVAVRGAAPPPPPPPLMHHHPGCSGVAAYALATTTTTTTTTTRTTTTSARTATTAAAAAAFVVRTSGPRTAAMAAAPGRFAAVDDEIDDLLSDFKEQQQQRQQQQQQQQQRQKQHAPDADDAHHGPSIERVSLASLAAGPRVTFANTLPPPLPVEDEGGPLQFSDGQARFAPAAATPAAAAAYQAPPPPPLPPSRPAPWAPARPLQAMTAVVGPGATLRYEEEALSFSRSRRRYVAPAASGPSAASAFRHPGM